MKNVNKSIRLLYITRKFPPMVGGMEKVAFALTKEFPKQVNTTLIAWGRSQKYLPFVYPLFLIKALYLIPTKKITHVHIGDPILSPLGLLLRFLFGVKTSITVHGLDITWSFPGYQLLVPRCVARMDKIICISESTLKECVKRGIPKEKCVVIPCGVYPEDFQIKAIRKDLEKIVGTSLVNKKVLITVGRLVERKGVYWFIKNVLVNLHRGAIYLVIGTGPEKERIQRLIKRLKLQGRVFLLGRVSDRDLKVIYNTADLFVMPNIPVEGDVEGFGIVALEAASTGLPVVAAKLDGIEEAVKQEKNGHLVQAKSPAEFLKQLRNINLNKNSVKSYTMKNFDWKKIAERYIASIR